jgi:hypothetical protein
MHYFSAHGLAAVLHLSERKRAPILGARKKAKPEKEGPAYFLHEVQFSAGIGPAHFPAAETGH